MKSFYWYCLAGAMIGSAVGSLIKDWFPMAAAAVFALVAIAVRPHREGDPTEKRAR